MDWIRIGKLFLLSMFILMFILMCSGCALIPDSVVSRRINKAIDEYCELPEEERKSYRMLAGNRITINCE